MKSKLAISSVLTLCFVMSATAPAFAHTSRSPQTIQAEIEKAERSEAKIKALKEERAQLEQQIEQNEHVLEVARKNNLSKYEAGAAFTLALVLLYAEVKLNLPPQLSYTDDKYMAVADQGALKLDEAISEFTSKRLKELNIDFGGIYHNAEYYWKNIATPQERLKVLKDMEAVLSKLDAKGQVAAILTINQDEGIIKNLQIALGEDGIARLNKITAFSKRIMKVRHGATLGAAALAMGASIILYFQDSTSTYQEREIARINDLIEQNRRDEAKEVAETHELYSMTLARRIADINVEIMKLQDSIK